MAPPGRVVAATVVRWRLPAVEAASRFFFCRRRPSITAQVAHRGRLRIRKKETTPARCETVRVKERCRPHRRQPSGPFGRLDAHGEIRWTSGAVQMLLLLPL